MTILPSLALLTICLTAAVPTVEKVVYPAGKEKVPAVLCRPAGPGPFPALIVVHGDFGLTDWVRGQARRLAGRGFVVLAPDLYRGQKPAGLLDAHILGRGLPDEQALGDLRAAVDFLGKRRDVQAGAIGIVGWDMGGGYALDAAVADSRLRAVVLCYGRLTTDPATLAPLKASVLGVFAGLDEGIPPKTIDQFRAAMRKAGKRLAGAHVYPGCQNGFLDPSAPGKAGPAAARARPEAWRTIDAYLDAELKR